MNEELKIIISAEIDKLKQELNKAKGEVQEFTDKSDSNFSKFGKAAGAAGKAVAKGMAVAAAAVVAGAAALVGLAESTREYRTEQAKLTTAFLTAGSSAAQAKTTYSELYRVLGDSGQATEAAQHLAKLTTSEKELAEYTKICQGVYATFGDSLAVEGLTEAINHTAQLGEVQGSLADALEWSGVNVDDFNEQLFWCNSEAEREKLIRTTLNDLYGSAAEQYETTAGALMDANAAQQALTDGLAAMGEAVEPIITILKTNLAEALAAATPAMQLFSTGLQEMLSGTEGGADKVKEGITQLVDTAITFLLDAVSKIREYAPAFIELIKELIPKITGSLLSAAPDIVQTAIELVVAAINGIASMLPEVARQVAEAIPAIIKVLIDKENVNAVLNAAINLVMAIVESIGIIIPILISELPELISSLIDTLVSGKGTLQEGAVKLFNGVLDALLEIGASLLLNLPKILLSITTGLVKAAPQLLKSSVTMFNGILDAAKQLPSKIAKHLAELVRTVKTELVAKLQNLLKFKWELPKLKMPSISVTWKDSPKWMAEAAEFLGLKGIPSFSVNWNKLGGVFDKPTVFSYGNSLQGIGEDGAEAVVPLENNTEWLDKIAARLADAIGGGGVPIVLEVDGKVFAKTAVSSINSLTKQQGKLSLVLA